jgi:hypothetical protein
MHLSAFALKELLALWLCGEKEQYLWGARFRFLNLFSSGLLISFDKKYYLKFNCITMGKKDLNL